MAIINYERVAENAKQAFYNDSTISDENKALVRRFEQGYKVKPARKAIFYKHIRPFLSRCRDLSTVLDNRDKVNAIFAQLETEFPGRNYYATIQTVTKMLARWLNEGATPKGFTDVKAVKKKELQRQLSRKDMITWEDGLRLAEQSTSIQIKAALLTQLDGGFRPSEFIDLRFGDITLKGDVAIAHVTAGKTGGRDVMLWRCVPYLLRWLKDHPNKEADSPLWVMENMSNSHRKGKQARGIPRYEYPALRKRIKALGKKAGLAKPLDFYNLRHSSCFLDKMDRLPIDLAAKRHGHSTQYFTEVYARLDVSDDIKRLKAHYGQDDEDKRAKMSNRTCARCEFVNPPGIEFCNECAAPLSLESAMNRQEELDTLKAQMADLPRMVKEIMQGASKDQIRQTIKRKRAAHNE